MNDPVGLVFQIPGQVPITIGHRPAFTVENFHVQKSRLSEVITTFAGNIGVRESISKYSFSFEMPPMMLLPKAFEVSLPSLSERNTWTYLVGTQLFVLIDAAVNSEDISFAMKHGDTRCVFRGNALKRIPE